MVINATVRSFLDFELFVDESVIVKQFLQHKNAFLFCYKTSFYECNPNLQAESTTREKFPTYVKEKHAVCLLLQFPVNTACFMRSCIFL
jgi:hypothetical protein